MRVKIIQKTVLTFCLLALVGFSAPMLVHGAEDRQSTDSDFHIDKEGCLTSYTGSEEHVVIPEGVKRIGGNPDNSIFEDTETEIKSVVIPDSVIEIGERAFYTCLQLEEVTMGNGVKKIGQEVFAGCFKMKTIHLSDSLQEIGLRAFNFCESLEALELPSSLRNIEMEAFGNCISLKSLNIPDGVQAIPPGTFDRCSSMEELYIPSSVTKIGAGSKLMPQYVGERTGLEDCDNLTIYGAAGSAAEKYAQEKDITFVEDESMQSTVIPDSEEEELETQEEVEEEEEAIEEETDKDEEEKKESTQKKQSKTSVDRVQIVGLTVGAVGLVMILIAVVIQIIRNSRRK
ncbi:leucine-rich repeat domain-containing protein [Coprococcus sp. AF27-8]|nr:leucine-rich repeat domain-containing protein [Coprococcus sp. AF27-8]